MSITFNNGYPVATEPCRRDIEREIKMLNEKLTAAENLGMALDRYLEVNEPLHPHQLEVSHTIPGLVGGISMEKTAIQKEINRLIAEQERQQTKQTN